MKYLITLLLLILLNVGFSQTLNYWNWEQNHTVKNFRKNGIDMIVGIIYQDTTMRQL